MNKLYLVATLLISSLSVGVAQGPPITADKPIMLGGGYIFKTLTEIRSTDGGTFTRIPIMAHHLPSANSLIAVHLPMVLHSFTEGSAFEDGAQLGDIQIMGKYQFFRKDGHAKTFRMVLKTVQNLPTGKKYGIDGMSTGEYQSYFAVVAGREAINLGLSGEVGYNIAPNSDLDQIALRLGAGLPVLRPVYPVKQLNLYFEFSHNIYPAVDTYEFLYAQGIQYAIKRLTFEMAYQWPISTTVTDIYRLRNSVLLGARFII